MVKTNVKITKNLLDTSCPNRAVEDIRKLGYKLDISHYRDIGEDELFTINSIKDKSLINPRGGETVITLYLDNKNLEASAICNESDNFCKKIGVGIALGRLLKKLKTYNY